MIFNYTGYKTELNRLKKLKIKGAWFKIDFKKEKNIGFVFVYKNESLKDAMERTTLPEKGTEIC